MGLFIKFRLIDLDRLLKDERPSIKVPKVARVGVLGLHLKLLVSGDGGLL